MSSEEAHDSWKESVRLAMGDLPKSLKISDVAKATGIDVGRLYNLTSKASLNSDELKILDQWLISEGYRVAEEIRLGAVKERPAHYATQAEVTQHEMLLRLSRRLIVLAEELAEADSPEEIRLEDFGREITAIFENLDTTWETFKKKSKNIG